MNFAKEARQTMGMELAKAEIYYALAAVFRRFDVNVHQTTSEDVGRHQANPDREARLENVRINNMSLRLGKSDCCGYLHCLRMLCRVLPCLSSVCLSVFLSFWRLVPDFHLPSFPQSCFTRNSGPCGRQRPIFQCDIANSSVLSDLCERS